MIYAAIDVETSGLNPSNGDRVLECAAVKVFHGKIVTEFSQLVKVPCLIPTRVTKIHGITAGMLIDELPPEKVWPDFLKFIGDSPLIAHNAPFDIRFIRHELALLDKSFTNRSICTLQLAKQHFPQLPNHRLESVARHVLGTIPADCQLHRALGDARLVAKIWMEMEG